MFAPTMSGLLFATTARCTVAYLQKHPGGSRGYVIEASKDVRQDAYGWLFKSRSEHKQEVRIRILLEQDAFDRILQDWQRQGYPFGHLVPSYGSAIGSSGDPPRRARRTDRDRSQ